MSNKYKYMDYNACFIRGVGKNVSSHCSDGGGYATLIVTLFCKDTLNHKENNMAISFTLIHQDKRTGARAGVLHTPHGDIPTPVFMPVGTQATVKSLSPHEVWDLGARIILSNTYHLAMRPGSDLVREAGGLHSFMRWPGAVLTDSGGFQVFSLAGTRKITERGVEFRSHVDGSKHFFTPESVMKTESDLGADIIMAFDECARHDVDKAYATAAMRRTHAWAERCKRAHKDTERQSLFGIVQGGMFEDLRVESARTIDRLDFPGNAIGGLSVGEEKPLMYRLLEVTTPHLAPEKPRYLMGVGSPDCLIQGALRGVDMFDCVMQTRMGRTGAALTKKGRLNLRNAQYARDLSPIEPGCGCPACSGGFTKAYIRHLIYAQEILAARLISMHNIWFTIDLMRRMREAILEDRMEEFVLKNIPEA